MHSFCAHTRGQQEQQQAESTTGQVLAERFLETQQGNGLDIDRMRVQGYDVVANMAGIHRGVQAIIIIIRWGGKHDRDSWRRPSNYQVSRTRCS